MPYPCDVCFKHPIKLKLGLDDYHNNWSWVTDFYCDLWLRFLLTSQKFYTLRNCPITINFFRIGLITTWAKCWCLVLMIFDFLSCMASLIFLIIDIVILVIYVIWAVILLLQSIYKTSILILGTINPFKIINTIKITIKMIIIMIGIKTINPSTIAVIHYFLNGHLSEASVTDAKYIKMTGLQGFY